MTTDELLMLPVDILVLIFTNLEKSDLRNLMLCCKSLRDLIKTENRIWRPFSQGTLIFQESADNRWFNTLTWYNRCRISNNWQRGCYKTKYFQMLVHHYTNFMPWLKFHKSEVLLLSLGSELVCYRTDNRGMPNCNKSLWKVEVPKVKRNDVRTNDISRFVLRDNLIVCGNRDGCVSLYKANNLLKKPKLECHIRDCIDDGQVEVSAVEIISTRHQLTIASASSDAPGLYLHTLRLGSKPGPLPNGMESGRTISLTGCCGIKCLSMNRNQNLLAMGFNGNSFPSVIDVNETQMVIQPDATANRRQAIRDIHWHDTNTLVYVTHSGFLHLYDIRANEVVYKTRDPFQSTLYCVKTDGEYGIMVGSAEYSRCVLFDARRPNHHIQMYFTQRNTSPVYCLDFDSTKLISAADRGLAVLNFNIDSNSQERRDYSRHVFH